MDPASKLLYASDAIRLLEPCSRSADGRQILGDVLAGLLADGDLPGREIEATAAAALQGDAEHLYGLAR